MMLSSESFLFWIVTFVLQIHCLQFLICELLSGGNLRRPGGLFGSNGSGISVDDLKQLETFFYKLSFFLHILDFTGHYQKVSWILCGQYITHIKA